MNDPPLSARLTRPAGTRQAGPEALSAQQAAALSSAQVLKATGSQAGGLSSEEVRQRREITGPNDVRTHHARALAVLARQLCSALLILLLITEAVSFVLGDRTDAVIIALILLASVGLGVRQRVPG